MFTAQLLDADSECDAIAREALADAGCIDIDDGSRAFAVESAAPLELLVVCIQQSSVARIRRLGAAHPNVPILAICDESEIDVAFAAGASQCATRPLRRRELTGRIREALRSRGAAQKQATRERTLSDAISALKREKQHLERLVCVDTLTGVANRRHAMELLSSEWKRAARDNLPLAVVMIDLDCFHGYNEQYGHPGGDLCLQQVADAMVRCLRRPTDFLGRYGGEEFMAVLPNTDAVGAKIVAERLRAAVEALGIPHAASTCTSVVTITAGFAAIKVLAADTTESLITAADTALLEAKRMGRNQVGGVAPLVRPSRVSAQRWQHYPPVYVDPWFADRIPTFLRSVEQEVRAIAETARNGERSSGLVVRRLRQGADSLQLLATSVLLGQLELAACDGDMRGLRAAADELVHYVTHVQIIYRRVAEPESSTLASAG